MIAFICSAKREKTARLGSGWVLGTLHDEPWHHSEISLDEKLYVNYYMSLLSNFHNLMPDQANDTVALLHL